jgi:hypothetical protein
MKGKRGFSLTGLAVIVLVVALLAATGPTGAQSGAPTVVSYQGQVTVGGSPYDGDGYFKFAVVNAAGDTSYWSNDGTSTTGDEPTAAVTLTVTGGLFNVLLGDPALMDELPATAFDGTDRALRVWFSSDGSSFSLLSPDRRIAAVPYALQAEEAKNAGDADTVDGQHASGFWQLTGNTVTNPAADFLGTTDAQPLVLRTNNVEQARLDTAGNLGLGTTSPAERLTVRGNALVLGEDTPAARGYTSTNLYAPFSVYVSGRYAYVASAYNHRLAIFDVSDPNNVVAKGYTSTNLDGPRSVYVAGRYAYVASANNDRLAIFDVSDPANIVAQGYTSANLDAPFSVYVSGRYAYVASHNNDRLAIFDVSDPDNIIAQGYTSANLDAPYSVYVSGRYAYVASFLNDRLAIFDVSNPNSIVARGYTNTNLDGPCSVYVSGRYAYVAAVYNDRLAIFDVSDPANIIAQGYTSANLDGPYSVYVAGRYAYVASINNSRLAVFEVNHLESPTLETGNLQSGYLGVTDNAIVGNNLHVQGGLNVGPGGALIGGNLGVQGNLFAHVSVTTVTGSATLAVTQSGVALVNNAAAATVTLPAAASAKGVTFTIKRLTANAVTVNTAGGTIDGLASQSLAAQYDLITVVSDGANWYIVGR